ncbi:hypothetical protein [Bacterioplanoides sp.]|uniref:hypothetical protein n=1 Tax=Bacterioplanoides sp. TaxID=2066072 RepID=UPI003B5B2E98
MKNLVKTALFVLGSVASAAALSATKAGTEITNTAIATYDIPGGSSGVTATSEAKFKVLELIEVNVTSNNQGNQTVDAGDNDQALSYKITNNGNDEEVFTIRVTNESGDNFDVTNIRIFIDADGDGVYDAGEQDITATPDITLAMGAKQDIVVLTNIPGGATSGQQSKLKVEASSKTSGATTANKGTLLPTGEVVGNNPFHSETDTFVIGVPTTPLAVNINKTILQIEDPFHKGNPSAPGGVNQYVPGSIVTYQIAVSVTGSTGSVNNLVITDQIPNEMTFVTAAGTFTVSKNGAVATSLTPEFNKASPASSSADDQGEFKDGDVIVNLGTANAGDNFNIQLQAEIK